MTVAAAEVAHDRKGEPGGAGRRGPERAIGEHAGVRPNGVGVAHPAQAGQPGDVADASAGVDAGAVLQRHEGVLPARLRNEMMALRCVTLSTTGPRVSATAATAAAITLARAARQAEGSPPAHPDSSRLRCLVDRRREVQLRGDESDDDSGDDDRDAEPRIPERELLGPGAGKRGDPGEKGDAAERDLPHGYVSRID